MSEHGDVDGVDQELVEKRASFIDVMMSSSSMRASASGSMEYISSIRVSATYTLPRRDTRARAFLISVVAIVVLGNSRKLAHQLGMERVRDGLSLGPINTLRIEPLRALQVLSDDAEVEVEQHPAHGVVVDENLT